MTQIYSWFQEDKSLCWSPYFSSFSTTRSMCLALSEMSQQLLDELPWNLVPIFMVPRGGIPMVVMIPWVFLKCQKQINIFAFPVNVHICTKFNTSIIGLQKMTPTDLGDLLTFPLSPTLGSQLWIREKFLSNYWIEFLSSMACTLIFPLQWKGSSSMFIFIIRLKFTFIYYVLYVMLNIWTN